MSKLQSKLFLNEDVPDSAIPELALLHIDSLPDSLLSVIGVGFLEDFYQAALQSKHEDVFVRMVDGHVVACGLFSAEPYSMSKRLIKGRMFLAIIGRFWDLSFVYRLMSVVFAKNAASEVKPELVFFYTASTYRGAGFGREILKDIHAVMSARSIPSYLVKTLSDSGNAAIDFYLRNGFKKSNCINYAGHEYQLLEIELLTEGKTG